MHENVVISREHVVLLLEAWRHYKILQNSLMLLIMSISELYCPFNNKKFSSLFKTLLHLYDNLEFAQTETEFSSFHFS